VGGVADFAASTLGGVQASLGTTTPYVHARITDARLRAPGWGPSCHNTVPANLCCCVQLESSSGLRAAVCNGGLKVD
jgi:hypothetical protein